MNTQKLSKTQIVALIGGVVGVLFGVVSAIFPQIQIAGEVAYNLLITSGIESVCVFVGTFKGYAERTQEEIAALTAKHEQKELAQYQAIVAKHEAEEEAYNQAKAAIAEHTVQAGQTNN